MLPSVRPAFLPVAVSDYSVLNRAPDRGLWSWVFIVKSWLRLRSSVYSVVFSVKQYLRSVFSGKSCQDPIIREPSRPKKPLRNSLTATCKNSKHNNTNNNNTHTHTHTHTSKSTMSKSPSLRRIQADIRELARDPSDRYHAAPLENDMFEW